MIRELTMADHQIFLELCQEFYHSPAVTHTVSIECNEHTFQELMRSDEYLKCYLFEADGAAAGYALLSRSFSPEVGGTVLWVEDLYLRPAFRGQGLGTEFLEFLEQTHPAARYRLEVEPNNVRAMKLYQARGYETLPYVQMVKDQI